MKNWTRFAMILAASSMVGCGDAAMNAGDDDADMVDEKVGETEQADTGLCDPNPSDPNSSWCNGDPDYQNGADGFDGWQNGGGWKTTFPAYSNNITAFNGVWANMYTDGFSDAWTEGYGAVWDNHWNYAALNGGAGPASFKWTETQSCAHPLSQTGSALTSTCNPMATVVCNADSYCCSGSWDSICVREATSWATKKGTYRGCYTDSSASRALPNYLGTGMTIEQCSFEAQGRGYKYAGLQYGGQCWVGSTLAGTAVGSSECNMACTADATENCGGSYRNSIWELPSTALGVTHPVTTTGAALSSTDSACAAAVIAANGYCATGSWTIDCVKAAAQICAERYVTRPRFDTSTNRMMVDICGETKVQGYPACPFAGSGPSGKECCRQALVLKGVYQKIPTTTYGTEITWYRSLTGALTGLGSSRTVRATIVPNRDITDFFGNSVHLKEYHLWQVAGPTGTIYPDCSGTSGPFPCGSQYSPGQYSDQLTSYFSTGAYVPTRGLLLAATSALLTTSGSFAIELELSEDNSDFPYHIGYGASPLEAAWTWTGDPESGNLTSYAACKGNSARGATLMTSVPTCSQSGNRPSPWPNNEIASYYQIQ